MVLNKEKLRIFCWIFFTKVYLLYIGIRLLWGGIKWGLEILNRQIKEHIDRKKKIWYNELEKRRK